MPELPEVETTLRGIAPHIEGCKVISVVVRHPKLRWDVPVKELQTQLVGQTITQLNRRAKYLLLTCKTGTLILHLGMSGRMRILPHDQPAQKHDHIDVVFNNKKILRFTDPRRFGAALWIAGNPEQHMLLKNLGLEPLDTKFNAAYLKEKLQNKNVAIKVAIMDQKNVVGVGNIYATEALFLAGIHPLKAAKSLTLPQLEKLISAIKTILRQAIKQGGTTLKDFTQSDGKPGYFINKLNVYGRANKPCFNCTTKLIPLKIGQRSTVYCKNCQS